MWNCVLELKKPESQDGKIKKPVRQERKKIIFSRISSFQNVLFLKTP